MTPTDTTQSARLLLIEDDPAVALAVRDALRSEGYRVDVAGTGATGFEAARDTQPQLVILDVRLPDGSGMDVCRRMRLSGLRQPVLILTANNSETDKVLGLEMGADDYLTKPFSLRELRSRVRALLRRAYGELAANNADHIVVGDLVIDRSRAQVIRGAQAVPLTPIEMRLLVHLAQHAGQALTRAQLLDAIWGYAADVESEKTVNVHIRRLRQKVEMNPDQPVLILTVPGMGYRLARPRSDGRQGGG